VLQYGFGGGHQKPGPKGRQNPTGGGGGHMEGLPAAGDPPHDNMGAWVL
jgi:hypothetical protein